MCHCAYTLCHRWCYYVIDGNYVIHGIYIIDGNVTPRIVVERFILLYSDSFFGTHFKKFSQPNCFKMKNRIIPNDAKLKST